MFANIKRNYEFILTKIILGLKENKEYKINLWSAIIVNLVVIGVYFSFFMIFQNNFKNTINFTKFDFIIYGFLILTGSKIYHILVLKYFNRRLINGDLNNFLTKPINPFLFSIFFSFKGPIVIIFPILLITTFILILMSNYSKINFLYFLGFYIFSMIYYSIFFNLFESLAFIIKENSFINNIIYKTNGILGLYPPKILENLTDLFYFVPNALIGYFSIQILKSNFNFIINYIPYLIIVLIIMIITLIYIWKIGIKKYEAFG